MTVDQCLQLAIQQHQAGRLAEAEQLYRQILSHEPNHPDALHLLGVLAGQVGRLDISVDLIRRAIGVKPDFAEAQYNLGKALQQLGQVDAAMAAYLQAIALKPAYAEAHYNLGLALHGRGQLDGAIGAYRQAIRIHPGYVEARSNLGNSLRDKGQLDAAIVAYREALACNPRLAEAHSNLGAALRDLGRLDEAIAEFRQAIALNPSLSEAYSNLGGALQDTGQLDEAVSAYRQTLALKPDYAAAHSNLVCCLHFHPGYDAPSLYQECRQWNQRHAEPLKHLIQPHDDDRLPDRRLRIGYVSPDLRNHCQALFMVPLLSHHDHSNFEVFCYADVLCPDDLTARLRGHADVWRSTVGLSDEQLAAQIRRDGIDILVDLTMHMARNRLLVFARKPAPVQVCWLAYPGTTGLSAIDYRLSDPYLDPPGMFEDFYSEKTVRLSRSFWCYDPLAGREVPISELPAQRNGHITFGCLNNFCKVNEGVLRLWAGVLRALPTSRLVLLTPEGSHRLRTLEVLEREGVFSRRLEFVARQPLKEYLRLYQRIDIGLDTFPYNGHTTSLDAYWMGVPVVTLVGRTVVGRAGLSQLTNLGLTGLIAHAPEEFVQRAVDLAKDLPQLAEMRAGLRGRLEQSPLMDAAGFARDIEAAYRAMWRKRCAEKGNVGR